MTDTVLVDARGQPLHKDVDPNKLDVNKILAAPSVMFSRRDRALQGAVPNPRRYDWKLYRDMYRQHPIVFAAIQKKVEVATNTGFDIVPRDNRKDVNQDEADKARDFFNGINIIAELQRIYLDLEIFGDGFLYIVPDRLGRPTRLKRLQPWSINIAADSNGDIQYFIQEVEKKTVRFEAHELLHFRLANPDDDIYGMSRLTALRQVITTDLLAEQFNGNFFANGATTGTIISIKDATQQQLEVNRTWIREDYAGTENAFKPIVLTGDIDVKNVTPSHTEMGFLEGRKQTQKHILAVIDVPPAKIGIMENANRSNSKEQDKSFRTESIMPLQTLVEEGLSDNFLKDIMGLAEVLFKHSEGDIRDAQEQMDLWESAARMGFLNINEVRSKMGYPEIEGGQINTVMTPTGAVPVADLELYFKLARINTDQIPPEMQDGHGFADGTPGPSTVGPEPKFTPNDQSQQVLPPANKALTTASTRSSLLAYLMHSKTDDMLLKQAYAYAVDAVDDGDNDCATIVRSLQKAMKRDDPILREAYIDRAIGILVALERAHD